jgi:hypothetical protein
MNDDAVVITTFLIVIGAIVIASIVAGIMTTYGC